MKINCRHILFNSKCIYRNYSSALYITGDKAQKNFVVLTPVIDFEKQLLNKDELVKNIAARGLSINIDDVVKRWTFFQELLKRKHTLELTKQDIVHNISKILKDLNVNPQKVDTYKLHAKMVKDDLKNLKHSYYEIEETTMLKILSLPNILDNKTPLKNEKIVYTFLNQPQTETVSNVDIGVQNNYIKYLNPLACYLKSDIAMLELSVLNYFRQMLLKLGYLQWSNPNFCRTVISEGCEEVCHSDQNIFTLDEQDHDEENLNRLHLCGSGSLLSFMAYFSRHALHIAAFPLRYFSLGKLYKPIHIKDAPNLFDLSQQTVVNVFNANLEESSVNVDELIGDISRIYNYLGFHYKIVILPASSIENSESLRISIQMYSNFKKEYLEVGNISFYDSYISKRLLFTYSLNKDKKYPKIVAGSLINFHKFVGCILENSYGDNLSLDKFIKQKLTELDNVE